MTCSASDFSDAVFGRLVECGAITAGEADDEDLPDNAELQMQYALLGIERLIAAGKAAIDAERLSAETTWQERFDNKQALNEGWGLFQVEGILHVQRIDAPDIDTLGYSEPKFASDADAIIFVALQAHAGSPYHRAAVDLMGCPA